MRRVSRTSDPVATWAGDRERARLAKLPAGGVHDSAIEELAAQQPGSVRRLGVLLKYRMATHYKSGEFLGPRIGDKLIFGLLIMTLYWDIGSGTDAQARPCPPPAAR